MYIFVVSWELFVFGFMSFLKQVIINRGIQRFPKCLPFYVDLILYFGRFKQMTVVAWKNFENIIDRYIQNFLTYFLFSVDLFSYFERLKPSHLEKFPKYYRAYKIFQNFSIFQVGRKFENIYLMNLYFGHLKKMKKISKIISCDSTFSKISPFFSWPDCIF